MSRWFSSLIIITFISIPLAERVLGAGTPSAAGPTHRPPSLHGPSLFPRVLLEAEDDDLGGIAGPLAHSQVQVTVDLLVLEEPHLPDLSSTLGDRCGGGAGRTGGQGPQAALIPQPLPSCRRVGEATITRWGKRGGGLAQDEADGWKRGTLPGTSAPSLLQPATCPPP